MKALRNLWDKWFGEDRVLWLGRSSNHSAGMSVKRRDDVLDILEAHGLRASYYLPAVGIEDTALADACRLLGSAGYIITDRQGNIMGNISTTPLTKDRMVAVGQVSSLHTAILARRK